jgi:hypothetical protein
LDDDDFFYPAKVTGNSKELTWQAGVRRFSYRKDFDLPSGNGKLNVQIAFNAVPPENKTCLQYPADTMPRFCAPLAKRPSRRNAKKGCAQGQDYGFILVVKAGGVAILLPELDRLWHIRTGEYCKSQANTGSLLRQRAGSRVPVHRKIGGHRLRRDRHGP